MFVPLDVCDLGATWGCFRLRGKLDFFWRLRRRQYLRCQEVWYSQHKRHNWGEIKSDLCSWNQIDDYDDSMIYVIWMQRFYVQHQIKSNISKLVFQLRRECVLKGKHMKSWKLFLIFNKDQLDRWVAFLLMIRRRANQNFYVVNLFLIIFRWRNFGLVDSFLMTCWRATLLVGWFGK